VARLERRCSVGKGLLRTLVVVLRRGRCRPGGRARADGRGRHEPARRRACGRASTEAATRHGAGRTRRPGRVGAADQRRDRAQRRWPPTAAGRGRARCAVARSAAARRTEPSTEKPPPCCHCPIARASSPGSRPRCTKLRSKPADTRLDLGDGVGVDAGGGMEDDPASGGGVQHAPSMTTAWKCRWALRLEPKRWAASTGVILCSMQDLSCHAPAWVGRHFATLG